MKNSTGLAAMLRLGGGCAPYRRALEAKAEADAAKAENSKAEERSSAAK